VHFDLNGWITREDTRFIDAVWDFTLKARYPDGKKFKAHLLSYGMG